MKDIIYLIADRSGVIGMRKTLPDVKRGETPIKLTIVMDANAFLPPTIAKEIIIEDWRQGVDTGDVEFKQNVITEEEAKMIRQSRMERMQEILRENGFTVTKEGLVNEQSN